MAQPHAPVENTTLRIVILAHGNRAEDDLHLVLSLNTTIDQLKQRIQESLLYHPLPELQRLIYQGRGLSDGSTTLKQILRIDPRNQTSAHVVHLVIRDTGTIQPPSTTRPDTQQASSAQLPQQQQPQVRLPGTAHFDQMRLHNQIHTLHHQMHHQRNHQINHAMALARQARLGNIQTSMHQNIGQTLDTERQSRSSSPAITPQLPPPPMNGHQTPHLHTHVEVTRVEERIGPSGEIIRTTITNNNGPPMNLGMSHVNPLNAANEMDRSSSAPDSSPVAGNDHIHQAFNPIQAAIHPHLHPHPQAPAPAPAPAQAQAQFQSQFRSLGLPVPGGTPTPALLPGMLATPQFNPLNIQPIRPHPIETIVWLLSSPEGPRGLVLAPGHGVYTSTEQPVAPSATDMPRPTSTTSPPQIQTQTPAMPTPTQAHPPPTRVQQPVATTDPAPPQPGAMPQPRVHDQPQPGNVPQVQANRNQENEFVQQVINRGWLFLRLYMFIFVLSETGTWRRNLLLIAATVFCLLPRENPLTTLFAAVRRHFDNLIGPPAVPAQHPLLMPPNNVGSEDNSRAQQGQMMPTPEEAARRLLEQQNRQNPNPILRVLRSIEQAVVLFVASLIPGLGERHVEARQQARRVNEEAERRLREIARASQPVETTRTESANKTDSGPLPSSWENGGGSSQDQATSSGSQPTAGNSDTVRLRNNGS